MLCPRLPVLLPVGLAAAALGTDENVGRDGTLEVLSPVPLPRMVGHCVHEAWHEEAGDWIRQATVRVSSESSRRGDTVVGAVASW